MAQKAVFLDRDGVLVIPEFRDGRSFAPKTLESYAHYPEAAASVTRLKEAGYLVAVITNQPDVGKGDVSQDTLSLMHDRLMGELDIDDVFVCTHTREDKCDCRKPKSGLLEKAIEKYDIDTDISYMVGDRASDVTAGLSVGCKTIFIDLNYTSEESPCQQDFTVSSIRGAADIILNTVK